MIILSKREQALLFSVFLTVAVLGLPGCGAIGGKSGAVYVDARISKEKKIEKKVLATPVVSERPKVKKPVPKKPGAGKSVAKKSTPKKSVAKESKAEKPAVKKTKTAKLRVKKPVPRKSELKKLAVIDVKPERDVLQSDIESLSTSSIIPERTSLESDVDSATFSKETRSREALFEVMDVDYAIRELTNLEVLYVHDVETGRTTRADTVAIGKYIEVQREEFSISFNNRYEVFQSIASNLVPGDENTTIDIFVRDTQLKTLVRASVDTNGVEGDGYSLDASISPDGRYIVFESDATNLVKEDSNGNWDIFLYDTQFKSTTRVSTDSNGNESINGNSTAPSISMGGRYVAFDSEATNLVPGDLNRACDVFVRDTQFGTTIRVSVNSNGFESIGGDSFSPSISPDGRYVTFYSLATNLVSEDSDER